jgi:glutamate racemase
VNSENPIGVFDSGIGGLTVVKKLQAFLPNERLIYFGDTARVPYGSKSNSIIIEYAIQDAQILMKHNVKLIVVACNTASSIALDELRSRFDVPIIGMIDPGTDLALKTTLSDRIGVIGTSSTIFNKAYSKMLMKKHNGVKVFEKACPLFVPLAEEGWTSHKATCLIAEEYLKELKTEKIDTLILGCTHYPILSEIIQDIIGKDVKLIDSGTAAAATVEKLLKTKGLLADKKFSGQHEYYVSDLPVKFKEIAERFLGRSVENVEKIDPDQEKTDVRPETIEKTA